MELEVQPSMSECNIYKIRKILNWNIKCSWLKCLCYYLICHKHKTLWPTVQGSSLGLSMLSGTNLTCVWGKATGRKYKNSSMCQINFITGHNCLYLATTLSTLIWRLAEVDNTPARPLSWSRASSGSSTESLTGGKYQALNWLCSEW